MALQPRTTCKAIGLVVIGVVLFGSAATWRSLASTDPLPLPNGAIFRLNPESQYLHGCFDPCMCPLLIQENVRGTFKLVHLGYNGAIHEYAVEDANWTVPFNDPIDSLRIIGSGLYLIGSPDPTTVVQHRMILDLTIGDEPVQHFDSGWIPVEDMSDLGIHITVSMNNMYCFDTAIVIDASPVPEHQVHPYVVVVGSTFQRGCFDPCDCLLGPERPMIGTFALVPLMEELYLTEFAVVNVDWHVLFNSVSDSIPIRGFGVYQLLGDFVLQQRLALDLIVGDEPRTHFDSGVDMDEVLFPIIDSIVSVNNIVCYDTVLHVIGVPAGGAPCGSDGTVCANNEFCKKPVGHCHNDVMGVCTPIPDGCPDVWEPVCGCDGITYGNECEADAAAMSIAHYGECGVVCTEDSECPAVNQFCKFPVGTCGDAAVGGVCTPIPGECIQVSDPVCGCDGVTYGNECEADRAAVSLAHHGPCETICRPADDGFGCVLLACSDIPEEQCIATVLQLDPATGAIYTLACECMNFSFCHVEFGNATPFPVGYCPNGGTCEVIAVDTDGDGIDDWFTAECVAMGACCSDMGGSPLPVPVCTEVPRDVCEPFGIFEGVGTTCEPIEACCMTWGGVSYCLDLDPFCCSAFGGVPQGPNSTCTDMVCGEVCGGFTGIPCDDPDTFCKFPEGTCNGADLFGVCTPIPEFCPEYYDPVCGCDGVTYDNECFADAAAVSIDHRGECGRVCGGLGPHPPCPDGTFCKYPEGICGDGTFQGLCSPIPDACPDVWDPVCGCDGVTYGNECESDSAGASVAHRGECAWICCDPNSTPPCLEGPFCCADGHWACGDGGGSLCDAPGTVCGPVCGGGTSMPCYDADAFCKYPAGSCGINNAFGMCTPTPDNGCPEIYDPVCGCDGLTYDNECEADAARVSIAHRGPCERPCSESLGLPECVSGMFCLYPEGTCDDGVHFGTCTPIPDGCPDVWDPVCGCDGMTHGNDCEAYAVGVSILHRGECDRICGGSNPPCEPDEFCKFPMGTCGDPAVTGVCTVIPEGCPEYYDPVCGCDGVTYSNECFADAAAVSVAYPGECEGTPCAATRFFVNATDSYCPGVPQTILMELTPPAGTTMVVLEDAPPAGWEVHDISHEGSFDTVNGKVKWGPFFAPEIPPAVSYGITPVNDGDIVACFAGTVFVDLIEEQICGDACIDLACPSFMEADLPQPPCPACLIGDCTNCPDGGCRDGRITLCELIGYACAWKTGCNDDIGGMARAAYVWRHGECYCWDETEGSWFPTACPPPASGLCDAAGNSEGGDKTKGDGPPELVLSAKRRPSGRAPAGLSTEIAVPIIAPEGTRVMAIEIHIPRGWDVVGTSDGGQWDSLNRKIKWGPFFEQFSRTVSFQLMRATMTNVGPKRTVRPNVFYGQVTFDGRVHPITVR